MFSALGGWIVGIGSLIIAAVSVFYSGKKTGEVTAEKQNAINSAKEAIKQTDKVTEVKANVENSVASQSNDDVVIKLHSKWSRD